MNVKNLKKGFTLTELIIVIVIIGILVGILVPTFVSVIRKANKSADLSLVRNLNDSLALDGIENGRHNNMSEAVEAAKQYGFDIEKISSKVSKNAILWDSKNDVFCYLDEDNIEYYPDSIPKKDQLEAGDYNLWIISDKPHASYSTYYIGNKESETVRNVGFDAGNSEIKDITYVGTEGRSVVIRTNGGTLSVDAPDDTINHYGSLELVDIKRVSSSSYLEYGDAVLAKIAKGRFVVTPSGKTDGIHAVATGSGLSAFFDNIVIGIVGNSTVPAITRDKVAIDEVEEKGTYSQFVLEVQALLKVDSTPIIANTDYIWINVSIDEGGIKTKDEVVASKKTPTSQTIKLNTGDDVQATASPTPTSVTNEILQNTEAAVYVNNEQELTDALSAQKKYIVLESDFSCSEIIEVISSVTIEGDNHTITTTASRALWVDSNDVTLTIHNLKIVGGPSTERGIQVNASKVGVKLILDNIDVSGITYYTLNICINTNVNIILTNSKLEGYGTINLWSEKYTVVVRNCELYGINDKTYNAVGWNDFGTVILEGDTTGETTLHSSEIDVYIYNTNIYTKVTTGNQQWHILFNEPSASNTVYLNNCNYYNWVDNEYKKVSKPTHLGNGSANKLYVDGELVD